MTPELFRNIPKASPIPVSERNVVLRITGIIKSVPKHSRDATPRGSKNNDRLTASIQ